MEIGEKMREQWDELKETIIELRDNNGTTTQQEICQFLVNLMNVLEAQMDEEELEITEEDWHRDEWRDEWDERREE